MLGSMKINETVMSYSESMGSDITYIWGINQKSITDRNTKNKSKTKTKKYEKFSTDETTSGMGR